MKLLTKKREKSFLKNGSLLLEKLIATLNGKSNPIRSFSIKELKQATNNYDSSLRFDKWVYSEWYRGSLEGRLVSVRRFTEVDDVLLEMIIKEITFATQLSSHKNVLKLLGCCLETQIPLLVYEYPVNGMVPLFDVIHPRGDGRLPWTCILRIACEIANVIAYLHTAFGRPIIHREVTPMFFFLDRDCIPKLSNFLFAIALPEGEEHVFDGVMGVTGFIDPEYEETGKVTEKVDVFSFGKLLLELLITGLMDFDFEALGDDIIRLRGGEIHELQQLISARKLAQRCMRGAAETRPTMVEVAKQLRRIQRDICFNMGSAPISSIPFTVSMIQMVNPLTQLNTVKLDDTNYLVWKHQVQTAIKGHGLEGFILGTQPLPAQLIQVDEDGTQNVNPAYISYHKQDCLIGSWILASMAPSFLPKLVGCNNTARDIWDTVGHIFASQSTLALASTSKIRQNIAARAPNEAQVCTSLAMLGGGGSQMYSSEDAYQEVITKKGKAVKVDEAQGQGYGGQEKDKPQCQLCGGMGHTVHSCCYRFDVCFTGWNKDDGFTSGGSTSSG